MEKTDNVVVYLDLLGFSNHIRESCADAVDLLGDNRTILDNKISDLSLPIQSLSKELKGIFVNTNITTFENFIPFSDSIFIMSRIENINLFVKQLSDYIYGVFNLNVNIYLANESNSDPSIGSIFVPKLNKDGHVSLEEKERHYYPSFFRGGMARGNSGLTQTDGIVNYKKKSVDMLVGRAVVDAVKMEGLVKGPRLLFSEDVYNNLEKDIQNIYCRQVPD